MLTTTIFSQVIVDQIGIEQDQGLQQRIVDKVIRDDDGFFYFFMQDAIQRFDGEDFSTINIDALKNAGLGVEDITSIGLLTGEIISLTIDKDKDRHYILHTNQLSVISLAISGKKLIDKRTLYTCEKNKAGIHILSHVKLDELQTPEIHEILKLNLCPEKIILGNNKALYFTDTNQNVYWQQASQSERKLAIKGHIIESNNTIYVWAADGISRLHNEDVISIAKFPDSYEWLTNLKTDKKGNTIASYSVKERFQEKVFVLTKEEKLQDYQVIVDANKKIFKDFWTDDATYKWMIVGYNGLRVISLLREGTTIYHKNYKSKKGEFGSVISGIAADEAGNTIILRESKGFLKVEGMDSVSSIFSKSITEQHFYNNGKIYYSEYDGSYYNYAYRYDGTSAVVKTNLNKNRYVHRTVPFKLADILPYKQNSIILGGYKKGTKEGILATYDFSTGKMIVLRTDLPRIRSIYYHKPTSECWIGTIKGVFVLDKNFDDVDNLNSRNEKNKNKYISNDDIVMVTPYADKLILGSLGGLFVVDPKSKSVELHLNKNNGLSNNKAIGLMPDDIGNCWITTFNGVNIMDSTFTIIRQIYDHQGLSEREFNSKAIAKDTKGYIYAGTLNGVTRFDPKTISTTWTESYGMKIKAITSYSDSKPTSHSQNENISFYSTVDSMIIDYQLPDYYNYPFVNDDTYISTQSDKSATIAHMRHKIVLTDIKPNDFIVTLNNEITDRTIDLNLYPKKDFRLLGYVLGLISLILLISYLIISYNNRRQKKLTKLNKKIADLELTSLQSQMNPHFIFNALGAIQYFIQTHNAEKADEYLSNFAMLMRRILESSKSKYITIKNEIETLKLYVGLEEVRFEDMFSYSFDIDDELDMEMQIPPMILQPYIENAINHGLYNLTDRKGNLTVKYDRLNDYTMKITVTDNGVGREKAKEMRTKRHKSRGLQIVKERIDTINSTEDMKVDIEVIDLVHKEIPAGTKVIITVQELE